MPDFRVVLADGSQWLIEVKNVYGNEARSKKRCLMKRAYTGDWKQSTSGSTGAVEAKAAIRITGARFKDPSSQCCDPLNEPGCFQ